MRIPSGVTDQYIYFIGLDAGSRKSRVTGLTGFTVYRSRNGAVAAAFDTPTVNETDDTDMPGVYELLLDEDMTIGAGNDSEEMAFHITASSMAPVTRTIELYRPKITAGNTLTVSAAGSGNADIKAIDADTVAQGNLKLMYNGTGYTDSTAPASRAQLEAITISGAAVNVGANASPNGFTLTTGSEVNNEDSTQALDNIRHELTDAAGTLDGLYKFNIGGDGLPVGLKITGVFNGNNDAWDISANAGTDATPVWQQIGEIIGVNGSGNTVHSFDLLSGQIVTDIVGEVQIRINGTGLTSSSFDVDQIILSKSIVRRTTGYALGRIWINTNKSNTNTEPFVDGTVENPVSTEAAYLTLSANPLVNITDFHVINGSELIFTSDVTNFSFFGDNWKVDFGGKNADGLHLEGADVSGAALGTGKDIKLVDCHINTCTLPDKTTLNRCDLHGGMITMPVGDVFMHQCYMGTTSGAVPVIDFGATIGNSTLHMHDWHGRVEYQNLGQLGTDDIHLDGMGKYTFNANCVGGTLFVRGPFEEVNNGSGITINDSSRYNSSKLVMVGIDVPTANKIADHTLRRDNANSEASSDGDTLTFRSPLGAVSKLTNKVSITASTLTITKSDDTTALGTQTLTSDAAADPITGTDTA